MASRYARSMVRSPSLVIAAGALATFLLALGFAQATGPGLAARLEQQATRAIAEAGGRGVTASFTSGNGWATRHPLLSGGERLNEQTRDRVAKAVAAIPGVAGIVWSDGTGFAQSSDTIVFRPRHCQDDVKALLRARSIRFEESSAEIQRGSYSLIDEVAAALRPCLGSIIAVIGHTDSSGTEEINQVLSRQRAEAVMQALIARGIPADGLRARGLGSAQPVEGLDPTDPANRRIEFTVVETVPIQPTPIDTPGPR